MSEALFLQHEPVFGPGRLQPIFRDFGIPCRVLRRFAGEPLPDDLSAVRVIVSLGGSARAESFASDPTLSDEVACLKRCVDVDRPVLGLGLGARLLAVAAGAKAYPMTTPAGPDGSPGVATAEMGWVGTRFPFPGGTEPIVMGLMDGAPMFAWNRDTLDMPAFPKPDPLPPGPPPPTGNALLSSTSVTRNAAFRFKNRLFGFQWHFELTPADVEAVLGASRDVPAEVLSKARDETARHAVRHARLGERLATNFVQCVKAYASHDL